MIEEKNVRLTISMPVTIFKLLEEVTEKNKRSKLIAEAVEIHINELKRKAMRERLIKGYQIRTERDKNMAEEWFNIEHDVCDKYINREKKNG